jgi:hypothetical protein
LRAGVLAVLTWRDVIIIIIITVLVFLPSLFPPQHAVALSAVLLLQSTTGPPHHRSLQDTHTRCFSLSYRLSHFSSIPNLFPCVCVFNEYPVVCGGRRRGWLVVPPLHWAQAATASVTSFDLQYSLDVSYFGLSWWSILIPFFRHFVTGSDESGWDHVAGELAVRLFWS